MKQILNFYRNNSFDLSFKNLNSKPEFTHSVWMVSGQILVSLVTFGMTYALSAYVAEAIVGSFRYVLALYTTLSALALVGMNSALMQSVAAGKTGSLNEAVLKKIKYGVIGSIILAGISIYHGLFLGNTELGKVIIFIALLMPWIEAFSLFSPYLNGASQFKYTSIFLTIERFVTSGIVMVVCFYYPSLITISASYFSLRLLVAFVLYRVSKNIVKPNLDVDNGMLTYAKHMTVMSLLGVVSTQLDKFILFLFFGPVTLASFWIASVIPQEVGRFIGVVLGTFFPRIVQLAFSSSKIFVRKIFLALTLFSVLAAFAYALIAKYIFIWVFPLYQEAVLMSIVLMFAYAVTPYTITWNFLTAKKDLKGLYVFNLGEPIILIFSYAVLVPLFGVWGVVWSILCRSTFLNLASIYFLFLKH